MSTSVERGLYRRRGSPYWWMTYSDKNGCTHRQSTGATSKKLAREILSKKRTLVAEGKHLDIKKVPNTKFFELCDQYWEKKGRYLKMKGLPSMIKIWKQFFRNRPINTLTQSDMEDFLADYSQDQRVSSDNRHITQLKAMFNWASGNGLAVHNPVGKVKKARETPRNRYLTVPEIQSLLAACKGPLRTIVEFALNTGMRKGEILDLKWTDVNLEMQLIWVSTSDKGEARHVPISSRTKEILEQLPRRSMYVFTSPRGGRYTDVKKGFQATLCRAGIKGVTFHDLRHTFASHLVMNGTNLKAVSELLGHSTMRMTERYAHLAPDFTARSIAVLDQVFTQKPELRRVK